MAGHPWTEEEFLIIRSAYPFLRTREMSKIMGCFGYSRSALSVQKRAAASGVQFIRSDPSLALSRIAELLGEVPAEVKEILSAQPDFSNDGSSELHVDGNYATLEKKIKFNPRTLDELLSVCEVDLDVWLVDRWVANKWDVGSKQNDGSVDVTPLYQIKVWLVRKDPVVCKWPAVAPVASKFTAPKRERAKKKKLRTALVFGDSQNRYRRDARTGYLDPMHDRLAWDIVCQVAEELRPDEVIMLGDMLDLADWSTKFTRTPDMQATTQPSLLELRWWIQRLSGTGARVKYLEGNHEDRMQRAIVENTVAAYEIRPANEPTAPPSVSIPAYLGLRELGVEYIAPYKTGEVWINDNLRVSHGNTVRPRSGQTAEAIVRDARCSEIFGHVHRVEQATKTVWGKTGAKQYTAASPGTLARIDPGIVPGTKGRQNWQQAFAWVTYEPGNGFFNLQLPQIIRGRSVFRGREWVGRDHEKRISRDVNWPSLAR